jgi:hypothetical protein
LSSATGTSDEFVDQKKKKKKTKDASRASVNTASSFSCERQRPTHLMERADDITVVRWRRLHARPLIPHQRLRESRRSVTRFACFEFDTIAIVRVRDIQSSLGASIIEQSRYAPMPPRRMPAHDDQRMTRRLFQSSAETDSNTAVRQNETQR